jgi:hypothetical protein
LSRRDSRVRGGALRGRRLLAPDGHVADPRSGRAAGGRGRYGDRGDRAGYAYASASVSERLLGTPTFRRWLLRGFGVALFGFAAKLALADH